MATKALLVRLEATSGKEASGKLVRDRLIVDESVCASRADGHLIELLGIERAALDARDFGADERSAVSEVRGAVLGPLL